MRRCSTTDSPHTAATGIAVLWLALALAGATPALGQDGEAGDAVASPGPGTGDRQPDPEASSAPGPEAIAISPDALTIAVGDTADLTAWRCDVVADGPVSGADGVPGTGDDACRAADHAVWTVGDDAVATLSGTMAPDGPAWSLTRAQRMNGRNWITGYFNDQQSLKAEIYATANAALDGVKSNLDIQGFTIENPSEKKTDWMDVVFHTAFKAIKLVPKIGEAVSAFGTFAYDVSQRGSGFGLKLQGDEPPSGPRVIPGVTEPINASYQLFKERIDNDRDRVGRNLDAMEDEILRGCETETSCPNDQRLAQWYRNQPPRIMGWTDFVNAHERAYEYEIYKLMLPIRARLFSPWSSSADLSRTFTLPETLNDTGRHGFGYDSDPLSGETAMPRYIAFTSVWSPNTGGGPRMQPWAIGLKENSGLTSPIPTDVMKDLFNPPSDDATSSGMGLSYQEVACEWLTNDPDPASLGPRVPASAVLASVPRMGALV